MLAALALKFFLGLPLLKGSARRGMSRPSPVAQPHLVPSFPRNWRQDTAIFSEKHLMLVAPLCLGDLLPGLGAGHSVASGPGAGALWVQWAV